MQRRFSMLAIIALIAVAALALTGCSSDSGATKVEANGTFSPSPVVVKAGAPVSLEFGQGSGCTQAVSIPPLGVPMTDLTQGGATLELPALQPGTYPLICQANMVMGQLVVQ